VPILRRPDGCRLHYELHGDPAREVLLLLEGMGGDIPGWRRNIPRLATELRVIAYDFRGNGESDPPQGPVTMDVLVEDTVALLDHLRVDQAHLYGQSLGGMVAQELALGHPERVRSLILGCTHPGLAHAVRRRGRAPKDRPWEFLYSERFLREHPRQVEADLRSGIPQPAGARLHQWQAVQAFDAYDRLPGLRVPTLILHGTEDRMIHPANARLMAERIPGARLVLLEGAGHVYHAERPEASDAEVLRFVRSVRQGSGRS
jgi:3-oxoadipate enol-lactonase